MANMIIEVRFVKDGELCGRKYTCYTPELVEVGDMVELPREGTAVVVAVHPDKTPEDYPYNIKTIKGIIKEESEENKNERKCSYNTGADDDSEQEQGNRF